jgi:predicted signal transduction protein with EAL and GGDEF domain
VVAEGVENEEQKTILCRLGCDGMQGYLLARPAAAEEIAKMLVKQPPDMEANHRIGPPSLRQPGASRHIRPLTA